MAHNFQTLSHLSHMFFFGTLRTGQSPLLNSVLCLRGRPTDSSCDNQKWAVDSSAGPPFPSFLTYRLWQVAETAPGGTLPLFSLITHIGPLEMFGKSHTKCRTRLFLARSRSFALISCFSASPLFLGLSLVSLPTPLHATLLQILLS